MKNCKNKYLLHIVFIFGLLLEMLKIHKEILDTIEKCGIDCFVFKKTIYNPIGLREKVEQFFTDYITDLASLELLFMIKKTPSLLIHENKLYINLKSIVFLFQQKEDTSYSMPFLSFFIKSIFGSFDMKKRKNIFIKEIEKNMIFVEIDQETVVNTSILIQLRKLIIQEYLNTYKRLKDGITTLKENEKNYCLDFLKKQISFIKSHK